MLLLKVDNSAQFGDFYLQLKRFKSHINLQIIDTADIPCIVNGT